MIKLNHAVAVALLLIVTVAHRDVCAQTDAQRPTRYAGGHSSALDALVRIAVADRVPMGLTLGLNPALCAPERNHDFTGLTTNQALESLIAQTSYKLTLVNGVYSITANDLSPMETRLQTHRFRTFGPDSGTMGFFGAWISGFIEYEMEGAGGFAVDVLGSPDDERFSIPVYRNLTAPQIANRIVKQRSKGIWVMQTSQDDKKPCARAVPAAATVTMYSYHDLQGRLPEIKCPAPLR